MPVSADLLKALAEDPKSLEHQLGCMAGLFQIFDRQGLGRRYGSKRVSNAGSGQSQPTSACETPRHDHHQHHLRSNGNNSADPYWMFVEDSSRFEAKNVSEPHHRTAYSDSSEIFTKSFETPTESRTEKSNQSPMYSEESSVIGGLASWDPDHTHDELKQLNVVVPARAQQQQQPATDIRDIVRASFERDHIQRAYKEKARHSVDVAAGSHGYLKNLPRSASVDGKDRSMVPDVVAAGSQQSRPPVADLPRSSSVGGQRGASRMLSDWKDGLRSSSGSPRLTSKERDALVKQSKNDNRDVTRLTVELKEGPRLSVSVDDRRASVDASPRPISRFRDVPVECPDFNRAADIKEFLRGEKKAGRDGHRFSVDGTRDAPRACIAPRLSVDGRDEASRKAKLVDSSFCRQSSGRKASNVVARLMGLEELPPKETTTTTTSATPRFAKLEPVLYDQTFLENNHPEFSPPPPPSPPDDYDYAHHTSDHEAFQQRSIHNHFKHQQELLNCQVSTPTPQQEVPPYIIKELVISPPEEQAVTPTPPRNDDDDKSARQLVRKSPQGRRSLWHIFEAMQLKGLLQGSSRRKQAEALRVHNLKMTESENEGKEQQRRSQSLPPRLNSSSSKDQYMDPIPTVAPAAALEIRKPSNDDDDCEVVIKPIITRSMSPYTKTQSPTAATPPSLPQTSTHPCGLKTDNARTYIFPDEDITPKMISRAMSKSVGAYLRAVVNEQEMSGDSTHSANVRQSRKERGGAARMTKSFSDAPQSEQRDSSPRCLRGGATTATTTTPTTPKSLQERPARSCSPRGDSSSISPRCPAGNVMENPGRVRRKAFAVKDREESKASLVHMRASATKQEFLKERASGDPDTPRLLRRSSSESKILSKMAESKPETRARSTTPPSMSLLRSKRPVGSKSDTSRSPMKTRPTAAQLGLKPVPKRGAAKPTVLEAAPADSPKASRCAVSEVRATQGGALDQSGDATAREAHLRTESKAREKSVEVDEGVKTPRGVSIKKIDFSEDAQAEVAEQPSPVSVLDNSHFDEELTPSPKAGKTSVVSLQEENLRVEKDRRWSSARLFLDDLEETGAPTAAVSLKVPGTAPATTPAGVEEPIRHRLRVCLQDADEESRYVEELVYASELGSGCTSPTELMTHNSYVMDPTIFDQLESKREQALVESESEKEALDRRVLFDCVNEVLERLLETQLTCARWALQAPRLRKRPTGRQLVKAVLEELDDIPCAASEDVCETVYVILQKDLLNGRGQQWPDSHKELEEVSVAVERLIVKDLIEETVRELWSPAISVAPESSRRQLFA